MPHTSAFLIPLCAAAVLVGSAAAQNSPQAPEQLSARDMFYHPVREETASATPPPKPAPPKKGKSGAKAPPPQVATTSPDQTPARPPVSTTPPSTPADEGRIIRASAPAPTVGPALGIRYTILEKRTEVPADTVFHTGDKIQLRVEANQAAWLYIISRGSSGTWKVLVPSADVPQGNHVEGLRPFIFPSPDQGFVFTDPKGAEKLFIIVSREPVADVQDQIYGLQGKPKPVAQPQAPPPNQPAIIQARLDIPDDKISLMRQMYSRDLIIEKVDPDTTGDKEQRKEFAVYVVNPTGSPNSRLVADISLEHQ